MQHNDQTVIKNEEQVPTTKDQQFATENVPQATSIYSDQSGPKLDQKSGTVEEENSGRGKDRKLRGRKTAAGKRHSARNSTLDGIFARQVVIEHLGEKREDFERLRTSLLDCLQPWGALEEQSAQDLVEYSWRRERVRRAAEQTCRDRLEKFKLQQQLKRVDEMEKLRALFIVKFEKYVEYENGKQLQLPSELAEVRERLTWIPEGIDFLLSLLESLQSHLSLDGKLIFRDASLLRVIRGSAHGLDIAEWMDALTLEGDSPFAMRVSQNDTRNAPAEDIEDAALENAGRAVEPPLRPSPSDEQFLANALAALIDSVAQSLTRRKEILQKIDAADVREEMYSIALDPSDSGRFSRAETQMERAMYRAFAALSAMKTNLPSPTLTLPESADSDTPPVQ